MELFPTFFKIKSWQPNIKFKKENGQKPTSYYINCLFSICPSVYGFSQTSTVHSNFSADEHYALIVSLRGSLLRHVINLNPLESEKNIWWTGRSFLLRKIPGWVVPVRNSFSVHNWAIWKFYVLKISILVLKIACVAGEISRACALDFGEKPWK